MTFFRVGIVGIALAIGGLTACSSDSSAPVDPGDPRTVAQQFIDRVAALDADGAEKLTCPEQKQRTREFVEGLKEPVHWTLIDQPASVRDDQASVAFTENPEIATATMGMMLTKKYGGHWLMCGVVG